MANSLSVSVSLSFPLSSPFLSRSGPYAKNKHYDKEEHDGLEPEDAEAT